ncbi:MAG: ATP-dependent Clp protease adapter ClpS [Acidimicrobiia bacterium]
MTAPTPVRSKELEDDGLLDSVWVVVVWDDPVTLMDYVVFVFRELFGYDEPKATELMLAVHNEGRAAVYSGPREHAELNVQRLHGYGLWATMDK